MMSSVSKVLKDDGARRDAISLHDRSILVEAGAGSGKTAVMAGRIAAMLAEGVAPRSIAAVTFTELAASELLSRGREFVADLSVGTIFYLFHPFHGSVARDVAGSLAAMAQTRAISLYVAGPQSGFREHFEQHLDSGALRLVERRGEFGEVSVLGSSLAPQTLGRS